MPLADKQKRAPKRIKSFNRKKDLKFEREFAPIFICPFTLRVGITSSNEQGQALKENLYRNWEQVFTGKDTIIATWDDSTLFFQDQPTDTKATGGFRTGNYYIGYIQNKTYENEIAGSTEDTDFVAQRIDKTITILSENWQAKDSDFFKIFVFPNFIGETTSTQAQLFIIENIEEVIDPESGTIDHQVITFTSLNQKVSNSGSAITNFIQFAPAGGGFAWPAIQTTTREGQPPLTEIVLDQNTLQPEGVDNFQVEIFGNAILSSIFLQGQTLWDLNEKQEDDSDQVKEFAYNIKVEKPYMLHGYNILPPIESEIKKIGAPETIYYWVKGNVVVKGWWSTWREELAAKISSQYARQLSFEGVFETNQADTFGTNSQKYLLWDNQWRINPNQRNIPTQPSLYLDSGDMDIRSRKRISDLLMLNAYLNMKYQKLNISSKQLIPWSLRSIPLIGGLLGRLTLGIPLPWFNAVNRIEAPQISGLMSSAIYDFASDGIISKGDTKLVGDIPMDLFRNDTIDEMNELIGTKTSNIYYRASISDVISTSNNKKVLTKYLGQTNTEGQKIYVNASSKVYPPTRTTKFIVDFINLDIIGKCDYKITFFRGDVPVWSGKYQTRSKLSGSHTDYKNSIALYEYPVNTITQLPNAVGIEKLDYPNPIRNSIVSGITPIQNEPLPSGTDIPPTIERRSPPPAPYQGDRLLSRSRAWGYDHTSANQISLTIQDFFPNENKNSTWQDIYNKDFGGKTFYDEIELEVFFRHQVEPEWEFWNSYPVNVEKRISISHSLIDLIGNKGQYFTTERRTETDIWATISNTETYCSTTGGYFSPNLGRSCTTTRWTSWESSRKRWKGISRINVGLSTDLRTLIISTHSETQLPYWARKISRDISITDTIITAINVK